MKSFHVPKVVLMVVATILLVLGIISYVSGDWWSDYEESHNHSPARPTFRPIPTFGPIPTFPPRKHKPWRPKPPKPHLPSSKSCSASGCGFLMNVEPFFLIIISIAFVFAVMTLLLSFLGRSFCLFVTEYIFHFIVGACLAFAGVIYIASADHFKDDVWNNQRAIWGLKIACGVIATLQAALEFLILYLAYRQLKIENDE